MMECVAMLSPREVPVAVSGTFFVIDELAIVSSSDPDITMGTIITHSRGMLLAKLYKIDVVWRCDNQLRAYGASVGGTTNQHQV